QVDRFLQTNREAIYALGDCTQVEGRLLPYVTPIQYAARALAKTLAGRLTPVNFPLMPIILKASAHPLVLVPPPDSQGGQWQCQPEGDGIRALFLDPLGRLTGFALSGQAVTEQSTLLRRIKN
ncbi:MAG: FAD-dependent oxidoreductase, partial [Candidatus Competibacteraceae bacterium]|nr:FAD-dependent oxidoreductase [Candidatus Competibacteraceae bacterium]